MRFGNRLKNARTELNLTQEKVANDFFITRQTVSSWENEKTYPDIASLIKISDYYNISLDVLLKDDTGMREFLEKKEVTKEIRPIYRNLIVIDLLVCSILIGDGLNLMHLGIFMLPLFFILLCTASALIKLRAFDDSSSLGIKYEWQKYLSGEKGFKYPFIIALIFIILGVVFLFLQKLEIGGIILIIGLTVLFSSFMRTKQ